MKKIVILHTDVPPDAGRDEYDTLQQADTIAHAITDLGHQPVLLPFTLDLNVLMETLRRLRPDVVFNLVETVAGRGSMLHFAPCLLDFLRIPYTGSRTEALFLTSDKPLAKRMLVAGGIATPPWLMLDGIETGEVYTGSYLMKPSWEDASVGLDDSAIWQSSCAETLSDALRRREQDLDRECFAELYIDGREFIIALLSTCRGLCVLPPAEILFQDYPPEKPKWLNYRSKWEEDSFEYQHTPRTFDIPRQDDRLIRQLVDIARNCWNLFALHGYARVDFRVDEQGNPFVLEINANPCLSPDAGFAAALEKAEIAYSEAIEEILQAAIRR